MMLPALLQAVPAPSTEVHAAVEAVVVGVIVGLGRLFDHRANKKRETREQSGIRQMNRIEESVATVSTEVRDLKAHVIGPDGQNGLRGDVRELKESVRGLEERERDRLPMYDRRAKP